MRRRGPQTGLLAALFLPAIAAAQPTAQPPEWIRALVDSSKALGAPQELFAEPPPAQGRSVIDIEEERVNFEYSEMVDRFETLRRTVVRGKNGQKTRVPVPTGVIPADRVAQGAIKKIVLHASGGAGSCDGSVSHLLNARTAAHFIVCRDGRVTRMVKIEDVGNHVRNSAINRESVGIETESGHPQPPHFRSGDWAPERYWRMYASLAWLIRAVAKETNIPRDRAHIITHEEADRGIPGAHTDPGPFFDAGSYAAFETRFPGQKVTPREYLMRLVRDDIPPQVTPVLTAGAADRYEVKDTERLGLSHVRVWRLDAQDKLSSIVWEWFAPAAALPPETLSVAAPAEPGAYRLVARDLVGNTTAGRFEVEPAVAATP